jgi:plastocyanin domain-containing protein
MTSLVKLVAALGLASLALLAPSFAQAATKSSPLAAPSAKPVSARVIEIAVTEQGFEPTPIKLKKGEPVKLVLTRKTEHTCATAVVFPDFKIEKKLPLGQPVEVTFTPNKAGTLTYGCTMGQMIAGTLQIEP